jgi:adenylate cyclase class IV
VCGEFAVGVEIELKFRLADPEPMRALLRAAGAEYGGRFHESDRLYDTADRRLLSGDCGLRVRTRRSTGDPASVPVHTLTFKGPRGAAVPERDNPNPGRKSGAARRGALAPASGPKVREEVETAVAAAAALDAILRSLGYQAVVAYEKRREVWQWRGCVVTIDELPRLGWWLEIEGPDVERVEHARAALGLAAASPVRETYVELAAAHGASDAVGTRVLRFAQPQSAT